MTKFPLKLFKIKFEDLISSNCEFALKSVRPVYHYENGKRTEEIDAFCYEVVDTVNFEIFEIKVAGTTPIVTMANIESAEERFYVKFTNTIVKPYKIEFGKVCCSIIADSVELVN